MKPTFTIIAPIYNEEACIDELYRRTLDTMEKTGEPWEFILVNDGSKDRSQEMIEELARNDPRVRPVIFARNFGHQIAVTAGMDFSRGDAVIVIDADLQDPPGVILELIEKWREGYEVVYAVRKERDGETWFKKFTASSFYKLIYTITDVKIPMNTGDFRLLDRKVVNVMNSMREHDRFLRGMSSWAGFKQIGVEYHRSARFAGETKYPLKKMIKLALNAITGFSFVPLQIATWMGFIVALIAILAVPIVAIIRAVNNQAFFGQASTLLAVLFLGGIQLIGIGILGEYIGRIYEEVKNRPLYITSQTPEDFEKYHVEKVN